MYLYTHHKVSSISNLYAVGVTKVKEGHFVVQKLPTFFLTENIHVSTCIPTYVVRYTI